MFIRVMLLRREMLDNFEDGLIFYLVFHKLCFQMRKARRHRRAQ